MIVAGGGSMPVPVMDASAAAPPLVLPVMERDEPEGRLDRTWPCPCPLCPAWPLLELLAVAAAKEGT